MTFKLNNRFSKEGTFSKEGFLKEVREYNEMPSGSAYDLSTNGGFPELAKYHKKSLENIK